MKETIDNLMELHDDAADWREAKGKDHPASVETEQAFRTALEQALANQYNDCDRKLKLVAERWEIECRNLAEQAYLAGFKASDEGYNDEYGCPNPENDKTWLADRDREVTAICVASSFGDKTFPLAPNISCKSVQHRLATLWGYVKADEAAKPEGVPVDRDAQEAPFEEWWEREGQFSRAGGGQYEKTFAWNAWCAASAAPQPPQQPATEYEKQNPLGGPAKVFDAMADAIRAGDSYESVLKLYGYAETKANHPEQHLEMVSGDHSGDTNEMVAANAAPQPICQTCNGNGLIGGPSFYAPDEGGVPCLDCSTAPKA